MMSKIRDRHMASARLLGWTAGRKAASDVYLSDHAADAIVHGSIHEANPAYSNLPVIPTTTTAEIRKQVLGEDTGGYREGELPGLLDDLAFQWDASAASAWVHTLEARASEMIAKSARLTLDREEQKVYDEAADAWREDA